MLRHCRLRNASAISQAVHGLFSVASQALEYRPTGRVSEGFEDVFRYGLHPETITLWLWVCQARPLSLQWYFLWGVHPA